MVGAPVVPIEEIAGHADLIFLTVPDDAIGSVAIAIAQQNDLSSRGFLHTSGAHDSTLLDALAARGACVGSLHPAFPFADVDLAIHALPGSTFALEAVETPLVAWARELVAALEGQLLVLPSGSKPLYHAALVLASNYTVTLYAQAQLLLLGLGASPHVADAALDALVGGTVQNLRQRGIPDALTGPLVRGDLGTIEAHLEALTREAPDIAQLYIQLARLTFPMLAARGHDTAPIAALLGGFAAHQE
jgi:predicted short-subunit dehydrogenase-like oxidoreductase (DUF2520 family)